ncbi:acyltransferase family protein [Lachnospiraceae bacterium WCA-9-b2]|uniref:Acyltransferase family protein n=1 Tax=Sporofaciens musculi TaxID=2681861 RepID=A0A7X3MEH6_9FIRM|nr:acyltransferase [Sporofaciens musculi]MXP74792.1 acyltransferase family protein [Sporofaciens musculi]
MGYVEIDRSSRNYGIDMMRILSMVMILLHHILGHGGIIESVKPDTVQCEVLWILRILCYGGVDCFALISGYIGYGSKHKYRHIIGLAVQVMFYTLSVTFIFSLFAAELVTAKTVFKAVFPISYNVYWYFSSYFLMFFLMPYMDIVVSIIDEFHGKMLIILCVMLYSVFPTMFYYDIGGLNRGYSTIWLCLLYVIGALFRKNHNTFLDRYNYKYYGWCYLILCCVTWLSRIIIRKVSVELTGIILFDEWLISYNSPTILIGSICLLLCFSKIEVKEKYRKLILTLSGASFGVYLLHEEPLIREYVIGRIFLTQVDKSGIFLFIIIILSVGGIFWVWFQKIFADGYSRFFVFHPYVLRWKIC